MDNGWRATELSYLGVVVNDLGDGETKIRGSEPPGLCI